MIGLTLLEHLIVTSKGYYEILANKENILSWEILLVDLIFLCR